MAAISGRDGLLPDRHAQRDFFLCDVFDAIPKDDIATMEHPVFSLSTRPDRRVLRYDHGPTSVEITPSVKGLATIHDKDVLIYVISQLMAALNAGRATSREVVLKSHDLLVATNRDTSGDGYRRLREAFERLSGTRIVTNIVTGGIETTTGFGLIETWEIVRRTRSGRMINVRVVLSDWLYRAVLSKSVLTLSRDYFRLRKPLERRVYELARKHCGAQPRWQVSLEVLLKKSGSASPRRVFRKMIRDLCASDHLPDYHIAFEAGDMLCVTPRGTRGGGDFPVFAPEVFEAVRAAAPGYDPYGLEMEWREMWVASGKPRLRSPKAAFIGFARKRAAASPQR